MNEIENKQHDQKIKELVGKVRQELGTEIIEKPNSKVDKYLSEIENLETVIPEETKKLWAELGIEEDTNQQNLIPEIKRIAAIFAQADDKKINVHFATEKAPQEQLKGQNGATEINEDEFNIYLRLDRKDKHGNFSANLVLWTFTQELTATEFPKYQQDPLFWQHFSEELRLVKNNLGANYQQEFELLFNPATFPQELLNMSELLTVYYPNSEVIPDGQSSKTIVEKEIIDKTWSTIRTELLQLVSQQLKNNPSEEELPKLAIKLTIECSANQQYTIVVSYHSQTPFIKELTELITTTTLKLEVEELKQKQAQLPTPENFEKLTKQNQEWEKCLRDLTGEDEFNQIKEKIDQIK